MEYNINFKYKSGGGTASSGMGAVTSARQRAIQASQRSAQVGTVKPDENSRKLVDSNIKLTTSILKLNQSVTMLTAVMKNRPIGGGGGGGSIPADGSGHSIAMIGAGVGVGVGALAGLTGFAVQKINQIGNAYIDLTSRQAQSVGVGGFRRRQGMYMSADIGEGMKSFGMSSGKFADEMVWTGKWDTYTDKAGKKQKRKQMEYAIQPDALAIQMGNIYGLSASEVLGQSGTFQRAGASYGRTAALGTAAGIETELPALMGAVASSLEEAVKNGINTSDMSKDLGQEMINLVNLTPGKSVEGANRIVKGLTGSKEAGSRGQVTDLAGLLGWKASREKTMEQFNAQNMVPVYNAKGKKTGNITAGEAYINRLAEMGVFEGTDPSQIDHIKALAKKGQVKEQDVQKITGGNLSGLIQLTMSEMSEPEYMRGIVRGLGKQNPLSAMQILNQTSGLNVNASQFLTAWNYRNKNLSETETMGRQKLSEKSGRVTGGRAGRGVQLAGMREDLTLQYGEYFGQKTMQLNELFATMADTAAPDVIESFKAIEAKAIEAAKGLGKLADIFKPQGEKSKYKSTYDKRSDSEKLSEAFGNIFDTSKW